MTVTEFGSFRGRDVHLYTLTGDGLTVGVTDFGAAVQFIRLATRAGEKDVTLGYNDIEARIASGTYCGATIGRVANRIRGGFGLGGVRYELAGNEGANCNHGGLSGFDKRFFDAEDSGSALSLTLLSPDGDGGFPGNMRLRVTYTVTGRTLSVRYDAESDADTLFSPTCHIYFNLGGEDCGSAMDTRLRINAAHYTPVGPDRIPTGELRAVDGTPFDFRTIKRIGRDIGADDDQLLLCGGYDHNYVLCSSHAATAECERTGATLDLYTDLPGLQLYTANGLGGVGKTREYRPRDAFCLEPQFFPNAINTPGFAPPLLKKGEKTSYYIKYVFGA